MKRFLKWAAIGISPFVLYAIVHLALIEVAQEIVIVKRTTAEGHSRARLWIVDDGEATWLHHGYADSPWILHLAADPVIEIEREGELRHYRAAPDPDADPRVHRLLRKKYGVADRLVRFWAGSDVDEGVATRATCQAIPVRLEPLEAGPLAPPRGP